MRRLAWVMVVSVGLLFACSDDTNESTTTADGGGNPQGGMGANNPGGNGSGANGTGANNQGGNPATGGGGASNTAGTVPCNGTTCAMGQVCCFDNVAGTQIRCDAPGACDGGHIELACNHNEDCPGQTCCSVDLGTVESMQCADTCDMDGEVIMCSGPHQASCPPPLTCMDSNAGSGYHSCQ